MSEFHHDVDRANPSGDTRDDAEHETMMAIVTQGVGDYDQLVAQQVPRPEPKPGEVLLRVLAAGVNNTEINTRLGWYSASLTTGTEDASNDLDHPGPKDDGGWNAATPFPLIQGADCCGRVVAVGPGCDEAMLGSRVLVRPCMRTGGSSLSAATRAAETQWLGSDCNGTFAQFVAVPASEVFAVDCDWSDAELSTIPCAYGTAENMVQRAGVAAGSRVLVPGASGGVGSALVQLLRRRGAEIIGIASAAKHERIMDLGATVMLDRDADAAATLGAESVDVVIDNVGGAGFSATLGVLRRGGTYVSSGAIAGPTVTLDMRTMYLKELTLRGCTAWDDGVFESVVAAIEEGEIRPLLERTFPLERIADAQREFLTKRHVGSSPCFRPAEARQMAYAMLVRSRVFAPTNTRGPQRRRGEHGIPPATQGCAAGGAARVGMDSRRQGGQRLFGRRPQASPAIGRRGLG